MTAHAASPYIINRPADWLLIVLSPLFALGVGCAIAGTSITTREFSFFGDQETLRGVLIRTIITAHLVIVFFRSHGNAEIFRRHPRRFLLAPVLVYLAMRSSLWLTMFGFVVVTWWDVYHSSLQTFGLGRIYDAKLGNDPREGRGLDIGLNLLLYAGPVLGGATLLEHVNAFNRLGEAGSVFFLSIPAYATVYSAHLTAALVGGASVFLAYYVLACWRLARAGRGISIPKVALLVSTGVCSIYTWGFNSFGEAFCIMNLFHAVQYFALVWWSERRNILTRLRWDGVGAREPFAFALFIGLAFGVAFWAEFLGSEQLLLTIAIMHFWYDGFIWSVRSRDIG
jgi:hypothetical protein